MSKTVKIIGFLLCFTLFISVFSITSLADGETKQGYIIADGVNLREGPNVASSVVTQLSKVNVVVHEEVIGEPVNEGYTTWYKVSTLDSTYSGYIYGIYLKFFSDQDLSADFEKQLESFPESYRESLRTLKKIYPNWVFIADPVTISFEDAVERQYSVKNRKQVHMTYQNGDPAWRDPRCFVDGVWQTDNGNWVSASKPAIAYFMDPRNSLNANEIYVFMKQSYKIANQSEEEKAKVIATMRTIIKGTFLEAGYDREGDGVVEVDAYIEDIIEAATVSEVSPYILASTIILEQGVNGTSPLISGTREGYIGYYNFFNFGASGATNEDVIISGLNYAVSAGWNSRKAAIVGGAEKYNLGYISRGQDTYYYKDFNLVDLNFNHQYAQSVYDASISAVRLRKAYIDNTEATLEFKIPVFTTIPTEVSPKPGTQGSGTPGVESVYRKGDINGDNVINALDLASVKKHILGISHIEGVGTLSADVNRDGAINALDLAAIKKDILGVQKIS